MDIETGSYFSEASKQSLEMMAYQCRLTLAAACVERVVYAMEQDENFSGVIGDLRVVLNFLWNSAESRRVDGLEIATMFDRCMAWHQPDLPLNRQLPADLMAEALAACMLYLKDGSLRDLEYAIELSCDAVQGHVRTAITARDLSQSISEGSRLAFSHPLLRDHVARIERDLNELSELNSTRPDTLTTSKWADVVRNFRARAMAESLFVFPDLLTLPL